MGTAPFLAYTITQRLETGIAVRLEVIETTRAINQVAQQPAELQFRYLVQAIGRFIFVFGVDFDDVFFFGVLMFCRTPRPFTRRKPAIVRILPTPLNTCDVHTDSIGGTAVRLYTAV